MYAPNMFSDLKLTMKDFIQAVGFVSTMLVVYFNLVDEIRTNKVMNDADKKVFEYRISDLEKRVASAGTGRVAVLP